MSPMLPRVIRQLVQSQLSEIAGRDIEITDEALLIRDGEYCGHRFHAGSLYAVWFREEDEIKCYESEDGVIRTVTASEELLRLGFGDAAAESDSATAPHTLPMTAVNQGRTVTDKPDDQTHAA